ncbi:MAG: type II toxin-antitoxin system VapC family toxin [Acidobacteria bacterium]|nr:type II toxin-antitoxin system VapC family toxin [Acidobacteriota bacterium]
MTSFVLDNSVSAAWCFEDQGTPYTESVLQALIDGAEAIVPAQIADLTQFAITVDLDGVEQIFDAVLEHARSYQRSAYDASYLELAKRRGLPLATKDEPLRSAASMLVGISSFAP